MNRVFKCALVCGRRAGTSHVSHVYHQTKCSHYRIGFNYDATDRKCSHRHPMIRLNKQRAIHNIDGTNNKAGSITHKCVLLVKFSQKKEELDFYVTNLGQDQAVLGYPFLKMFNPDTNWTKGNLIEGNKVLITPKQMWGYGRRTESSFEEHTLPSNGQPLQTKERNYFRKMTFLRNTKYIDRSSPRKRQNNFRHLEKKI
jgi:hypothetical protein